MKIKRNVIVIIIFILIIVMVGTYLLMTKSMNKNNDGFTKSLEEFKEKLANNCSECNYEDYVSIEKNLKITSTSNNEIRENITSLDYYIRWENITYNPISLNIKIYCEKEFRDKYVMILEPMLKQDEVPVVFEKGKGWVVNHSTGLLKPYDKWNDKEKKEIDRLAKVLYVEMCINGKFCYYTLQFE